MVPGGGKAPHIPLWSSFCHIGDTPPSSDATASYKPDGPTLDWEILSWTPLWDEKDAEYGDEHHLNASSVPCVAVSATPVTLDPITGWSTVAHHLT